MKKKIILAYSGGLDTSVIIPWLKENYNCSVIAVTVDLGQGKELKGLEKKALKSGADKFYIKNVKKEFAEQYVWPLIKSTGKYEQKYLPGTLSRPLIAKTLVEVAKQEKADAICHGATGKGNDQVRFELAIQYLSPQIEIIAPWRTWNIKSRSDALKYAAAHNIPVPVTKEKPYSQDKNLLYVSHEGGTLENIQNPQPNDILIMSKSLEEACSEPELITVTFEQGIPKAVNGTDLNAIDLIETLNEVAGKHGIGVVDIVENRITGMKSRGIYESPGGEVIFAAHQALESVCLDKATQQYKEKVAIDYANLVYSGFWFSPLKKALDSFIEFTQKHVSGTVEIKLYKGNCIINGLKPLNGLYNEQLSTFEEDKIYNQQDAQGFINITGLSLKTQSSLQENKK